MNCPTLDCCLTMLDLGGRTACPECDMDAIRYCRECEDAVDVDDAMSFEGGDYCAHCYNDMGLWRYEDGPDPYDADGRK